MKSKFGKGWYKGIKAQFRWQASGFNAGEANTHIRWVNIIIKINIIITILNNIIISIMFVTIILKIIHINILLQAAEYKDTNFYFH